MIIKIILSVCVAGLCRTSEVFGVSEFVLGRLQNVEEPGFQGLSVTAHKWIPITEVRPRYRAGECVRCNEHIEKLTYPEKPKRHPIVIALFFLRII